MKYFCCSLISKWVFFLKLIGRFYVKLFKSLMKCLVFKVLSCFGCFWGLIYIYIREIN